MVDRLSELSRQCTDAVSFGLSQNLSCSEWCNWSTCTLKRAGAMKLGGVIDTPKACFHVKRLILSLIPGHVFSHVSVLKLRSAESATENGHRAEWGSSICSKKITLSEYVIIQRAIFGTPHPQPPM